MTNQQLLDYIRQQLQQGTSREQIKSSLMSNGWENSDIEEGFNANVQPVSSFTNPNPQYNKKNKKILFIILIVVALSYYWLLPFGRFIFQYINLNTIVSSLSAPTIEKIYVLPSYKTVSTWVNCGTGPACNELIHTINNDKNKVLIIGKNFQSLDYKNSTISVNINGQDFSPYKPDDSKGPQIEPPEAYDMLQVKDTELELEINSNLLSNKENQILVTRDGKISNIYSTTQDDINNQLEIFTQSKTPSIVDAIPTGYPFNQYGAQEINVRFLITGWPNQIQQGTSPNSISCILKIDSETYNDCYHYYNFDNLNIFDWQVALDKPSHEVSIILGDVSSASYPFDTSQFEQYSKARVTNENNYSKDTSSLGNGTFSITQNKNQSLLGLGINIFLTATQNKNQSLPGLGINIFLTLIIALLFKPWRLNKKKRWIMTSLIPVTIPILFYIVLISMMFLGGGFGAGFAGAVLGGPVVGIFLAIYSNAIPLLESIIVALVMAYSVKSIRGFSSTTY